MGNAFSFHLETLESSHSGKICGPYYNFDEPKKMYFISLGEYSTVSKEEFNDEVISFEMNTSNTESQYGIINYEEESDQCPKYIADMQTTWGNYNDNHLFEKSDDEKTIKEYNKPVYKLIDEKDLMHCEYNSEKKKNIHIYYYNKDGKSFAFVDAGTNDKVEIFNIAQTWAANNVTVGDECPALKAYDSGSGIYIAPDSESLGGVAGTFNLQANGSSITNSNMCTFYDIGLKQVDTYYQQMVSCSDTECENQNYNKITQYDRYVYSQCNGLFSNQNYDDGCLKRCLSFEDDINNIRSKYGLSRSFSACGLNDKIINYVANIFKWIKYFAPVLVIILSLIDFIKAIAAQNDDDIKKAQARFIKRLIAAALLFLIPFIIQFALEKFDIVKTNHFCKIIKTS